MVGASARPTQLWTKTLNVAHEGQGVHDDGEVIENPQDITIVTAPVDLSAAPSVPTLLISSINPSDWTQTTS